MKRNMIRKILVPACFIGICVYGCDYDNEEELFGLQNCDTTNVSFSATIEPLILTNCAIQGCHVPGNGRVLLRNYEEIKENVDNGSIWRHAIRDKDMPPDGPLPICDIRNLEAWIDAGAPDN